MRSPRSEILGFVWRPTMLRIRFRFCETLPCAPPSRPSLTWMRPERSVTLSAYWSVFFPYDPPPRTPEMPTERPSMTTVSALTDGLAGLAAAYSSNFQENDGYF